MEGLEYIYEVCEALPRREKHKGRILIVNYLKRIINI